MKKNIFTALAFLTVQLMNSQVSSKLFNFTREVTYTKEKQLSLLTFKESQPVREAEVMEFINSMIFANSANKVAVLKTEKDDYGFTHTKFSISQNGAVLSDKIIIAHCKNGQLQSLNGDLHPFTTPANKFLLTEKTALAFALKKVNAKIYKWEKKQEEAYMREALNKPDFTFYPWGTKVIYEREDKFYNAYKFTIYADVPLYKADVFVDASTGKVLGENNLICTTDVPGSLATKYSGTQTVTCDQTGAVYSLKESARGMGIETRNTNYTTNYTSSTSYTNTSATWTGVNADQGARDAHFGAEKTYDYYMSQHNRNSVDNAGFKILSYTHYNTNLQNAFWDGLRVSYGDGNGTSVTMFTSLDICGHELTHGVTGNSAGLIYSNESGALNESYSDIFGTCVEAYTRPLTWNWKCGEDIYTSGSGLRNLSNPNQFQNPDTYTGQYWYTGTGDNGGVHTNSGVSNYWFYLLTTGGSGTNDLLNAYSVTGIGMTAAAKIAYRALTVYYTPSTNYANARILSIQAAKDLYGDCSIQVEATAKAWYAVGVGGPYSNAVISPNFTTFNTNFCTLPAVVNFVNTSSNGQNYTWFFGDGTTATGLNASHTYTAAGSYNVKLKATGCANALDSITKPSYIVINVPALPVATGGVACGGDPAVLSAVGTGFMSWFISPFATNPPMGTGNSFTTPNLTSNTTFYVSNSFSNAPAIGGMLNTTGGTYNTTTTNYLLFDVMQNCTLNTVIVQANVAGNRIVELRSAGTVLNTTTILLTQGANTLTLNYPLTPGTNYELGLSPGSMTGLYRSTTGFVFPYNIGGCLSIKGSDNGYYYWFYKWTITKADCISPLVAVTASVAPKPAVSLSAPVQNFCAGDAPVILNGVPAGGIYSGLNVSGGLFFPVVAGTANVLYNYSDPIGCSDTSSINMNVMECTGINALQANDARLSIFPNPATDHVIIKNELGDVNISISDASGRLVFTKAMRSGEENLNLHDLAKGLYLLNVKDRTGQTVKTVKLVRE